MAWNRKNATSKWLLLGASISCFSLPLPVMALAAEHFDAPSALVAETPATDGDDVPTTDSTEDSSDASVKEKSQSKKDGKPAKQKADKSKSGKSKDSKPAKEKKKAKAEDASSTSGRGAGLDGKTMQLVNQGRWVAVIDRLEKETAGSNTPTRNHAWLAFAYMFQNKASDLKKLTERLKPQSQSSEQEVYMTIMKAFSEVLDAKLDVAQKTLASIPEKDASDTLVNFALAAVSGKQGKAAQAADYCRKAIALEPNFAWGYRTLGYLQSRWLNQGLDAEKAFQEALRIEPGIDEVREMLINEHLARNEFDDAIDIALAGIKTNAKDGKSHYRLSQIYIQQWRLREALVELQKAISADPDTASYYRTRATIERYQGRYGAAIEDQKKAMELSKDKPFEMVELASMYVQQGDVPSAVSTLNEALKIDPGNRGAQKSLLSLLAKEKRFEELVAAYKSAIKSQPKDASLHFNLAETLHILGEDDDAVNEYKETANLDQKDARPHRRLGLIYSRKRDFESAEKSYRRALDINPSSVQDLVNLGFCFAQRENYLQAEAGFVTGLALQQLTGNSSPEDPKREDIIRSLASLLIVEGRFAEAANQLETVYGITRDTDKGPVDKYLLLQAKLLADRKSASANDLLAYFKALPPEKQVAVRYTLVQTLLKAGRAKEAQSALNDLSETESDDPRWESMKARIARLSGDLEKARSLIDEGIEKASSAGDDNQILVAEMLLEKAKILSEAGKLKEAEDAANQALGKYDKVYASYLVLGQIKLKQNNLVDAEDFAKKVLEQNPYFTDAYILMGDICLKKGKARDAVENYKKATEIYPGLVSAHKALLRGYKALALNDEAKAEQLQIERMEEIN